MWVNQLAVTQGISSLKTYWHNTLYTYIHVILLTPLNAFLKNCLKTLQTPCSNERFPSGAQNERRKAFPALHPSLLPRSRKTRATGTCEDTHFGQTDQ